LIWVFPNPTIVKDPNNSIMAKTNIDFNNTEIAFAHLSNSDLRRTAWLFRLMNKPWLVKYGSGFGLWAVERRIPFAETVVKSLWVALRS
jgi:proline dehydrogenase